VTGASRRRGIGTAICRALAREGADVVFTYWHEYDQTMAWGEERSWPAELTLLLEAEGVRAIGLESDLSDASAPAALLERVQKQMGEPSILVNNAAHSMNDGYEQLDARSLDAHYAVNVRAACLLSVDFAKRFSFAAGGRIINMISGQDKGPMVGELAYAATKGAMSAFTVSLAAELASRHITVNAVDPGPTDTGWMNDEVKQHILNHSPMSRMGTPEDAARLVAFLASDAAAWITGQRIHSDGGFRG
jgi:3-oxoacyl-[acyl-carrier protein] reductase